MADTKKPSVSRKFKGFTLVELIVVITILTILGTIGFIAMKDYGASARDSVRISDIKNNFRALSILQVRSTTFPMPEGVVTISDGTADISYQGYLGADISRIIGMNTPSLDPKDKSRYTYAIDAPQKKAQLMGFLESGENVRVLSLLEPAYAGDYSERHVYVDGDIVGILTSGAGKAPIQETLSATGVNLGTADTSGYVAYFGGTVFGEGKSTGTGNILVNQLLGAAAGTIPCNPISFNGYSIGALSHNETRAFQKPLIVANGSGTGTLAVTCANGTLNAETAPETTSVSCSEGYVNAGNGQCVADLCGGGVPANAHVIPGGTQSASANWSFATDAGTCKFGCDANYAWNGSACVADTRTASCGGSVAQHATDNSSATTWTQTWGGLAWGPDHSYARSAASGTCTFDCSAGYSWDNANQLCALNAYVVSGSFGANGANATITVCGTSVTADGSGNFSRSGIVHGSVCNDVSATSAGYSCTTVTNAPASLTGSVTGIGGNCSANSCAANPSFANIGTLTVGTPTAIGQVWTYAGTPGNCTYACTGGYSGNSCATPPPDCTF